MIHWSSFRAIAAAGGGDSRLRRRSLVVALFALLGVAAALGASGV